MKVDFESPTFKLQLTLHKLNVYKFPECTLFLAFEDHRMHLDEHVKLIQDQFSIKSMVLPYDK